MQKISTCLWFNGQAEQAARFYTSIFKNSRIGEISYYGPNTPGTEGSVLTVAFQIEGQDFMALNGGPDFQFTPAISFVVDCHSQEEVDTYWDRLLEGGGRPDQCGWLVDRFGVSWQIVPSVLNELLRDPDGEKANRVMQAMLQMVKLDIAELQRASEG
jgi:predicted 3-demethylubiquinone-9 3-methyltransferase (glyoxalase superfamily)